MKYEADGAEVRRKSMCFTDLCGLVIWLDEDCEATLILDHPVQIMVPRVTVFSNCEPRACLFLE